MKKKRLFYTFIIITIVWLIILSIFLFNKSKTAEINEISEYNVSGFSTDLTKIYDNNKSSVVTVESSGRISTGFIYTKKDNIVYIVSTYHGINDSNINIYFDNGIKAKGNLKDYDIYADVCLIEVEFDYDIKPITIGDSLLINTGEFVLGIGNANKIDYGFSSQFGIISNKYRELENNIFVDGSYHNYYLGLIQLSGEFVNGYSGSPIFNMKGEAVGIINMKDDDVIFALPINEVKIIVDKMLNDLDHEKILFGLKGLYIKDLEKYEATYLNIPIDINNGYYVENIIINSLAYRLGINKGDIILSINSIDINNFKDFLEIAYDDVEEFDIILVRNNETIELKGSLND